MTGPHGAEAEALGGLRFTVADGVELPPMRDGQAWVVGAIVIRPDGKAFAQKRGPDRRLFPDTWDILGGHVDPGEGLLEALEREIAEETGWRLRRVVCSLGIQVWVGDDGRGERHEIDFVVEVDGDLARPALEWDKHSAFDWFGPGDLERLTENRPPSDTFIGDVVAKALGTR